MHRRCFQITSNVAYCDTEIDIARIGHVHRRLTTHINAKPVRVSLNIFSLRARLARSDIVSVKNSAILNPGQRASKAIRSFGCDEARKLPRN
jgi:hypothetical protein